MLNLLLAAALLLQTPANVQIAWNQVTGATGYRVYMQTADPGTPPKFGPASQEVTKTEADIVLRGGPTYFIAVTAFGADGSESGYSDVIQVRLPWGLRAPDQPRITIR